MKAAENGDFMRADPRGTTPAKANSRKRPVDGRARQLKSDNAVRGRCEVARDTDGGSLRRARLKNGPSYFSPAA